MERRSRNKGLVDGGREAKDVEVMMVLALG